MAKYFEMKKLFNEMVDVLTEYRMQMVNEHTGKRTSPDTIVI